MDQRRLTYGSGRLMRAPLSAFWQAPPTVDAADPSIPNLPLEAPDTGLTVEGTLATATLTSLDGQVTFSKTVVGTLAALSFEGIAAVVAFGRIITATLDTLSFAGLVSTIRFNMNVAATRASAVIDGFAAAILLSRTVATGAPGEITFAAFPATIDSGGGGGGSAGRQGKGIIQVGFLLNR